MKIVEAIRIASSEVDAFAVIEPFQLLEQSHHSGNRALFYCVYKWLEDSGVISHDRNEDKRVARFISIFREMWPDVVYLEDIDSFI